MSTDPATGQRALLDSLRRRRAELRGSMSVLENALAAPATGDAVSWAQHVHEGLESLADDFTVHIDITEGPDGLYAELQENAPRLTEAVARLTEEHVEIKKMLDEALSVEVSPRTPGDVDVVRGLGTSLLGRLVRHRQRGSDLVYEAYEFDIGGDT